MRRWQEARRDDRMTGRRRASFLALAAVYEGASRSEAAKIGGVTLQIVRDWVMKFNAQGPEGLIDRKPPGQAPRLNDEHRAALAAIIESGPIFDIAIAEREADMQPNRVADDLRRKLAAGKRNRHAPSYRWEENPLPFS
jgi:transposase